MADSDAVRAMRRELGRQLRGLREAAGYTQDQLARRLPGYSRQAVSAAERGEQAVNHGFWRACDRVLRCGPLLAQGYSRIVAQRLADTRPAPGRGTRAARAAAGACPARSPGVGLLAASAAQAAGGYRDLGWPVREHAGHLELVTGTVVDALEVPAAAGILAAGWWRYTDGHPDQVRGLPALPDPAHALAVVAAGGRCFFLAGAGGCPWTAAGPSADGGTGAGVIRWHSGGSRIPAPPGCIPGGGQARWAHLPAGDICLPPAAALLDLLAKATAAAASPGVLTLAGGIKAVPALGQ